MPPYMIGVGGLHSVEDGGMGALYPDMGSFPQRVYSADTIHNHILIDMWWPDKPSCIVYVPLSPAPKVGGAEALQKGMYTVRERFLSGCLTNNS